MKQVYITEKPSQGKDYAHALKLKTSQKKNGYIEDGNIIVTWCVGHLVEMCYPEEYDPDLKSWKIETLPFIPDKFKYKVIGNVKEQFDIVKNILTRSDVDTIYFAGDSGREGQYIEELVIQMCGPEIQKKKMKRVWIDSTTDDAIHQGIRTAKDMSEYRNLGEAGYLRAIEDFLMGINFSRLITIKYGNCIKRALGKDQFVIAVGRVMSCVLAMIVQREHEIKNFKETPFYGINGMLSSDGLGLEWKAVEGSKYWNSPLLFKENGFKEKADAEKLIASLDKTGIVEKIEQKKEQKSAPLLYNLAELQGECSRKLKISPDQTLQAVQELYEKKLVTYPRTDARVLSTAVAVEITKNLRGLKKLDGYEPVVEQALKNAGGIANTRYTNDKKITDHYAIIPTGFGLESLNEISGLQKEVYQMIVKRFLSIFLPAAEYKRLMLEIVVGTEHFFYNEKILISPGFLKLYQEEEKENTLSVDPNQFTKGKKVTFDQFTIREGKTSPPSRYTSGSMILAMENAGNLIEDPELREQIKGSGIGTSATRAGIITKLSTRNYIKLDNKSQVLTPTAAGEYIYVVLSKTIPTILNPRYTASWERGLAQVEQGLVSYDAYLKKLEDYIRTTTDSIKSNDKEQELSALFGVKELKSYPCPKCGKALKATNRFLKCTDESCGFLLWRKISQKELPEKEIENLLTKKRTGVINGFLPKPKEDGTQGKPFSAALYYDSDWKLHFEYEKLICPCCKGTMREFDWGYACSNRDSCGFKFGKEIKGKKITPNAARDIITKGKTSVLKGFKGKDEEKFDGYLYIKDRSVRIKAVKK